MPSDIAQFIDLLKKIDSGEEVAPQVMFLSEKNNRPQFVFALHEEASGLACEHLIGGGAGGVDWANVKLVESNGFKVFPLESDSFGWLIGGIQTNLGVISFG